MTSYRIWRRVAPGSGHARIFVWVDESGEPLESPGKGEAQCATLEGIPFVMKRRDLKKRYEAED